MAPRGSNAPGSVQVLKLFCPMPTVLVQPMWASKLIRTPEKQSILRSVVKMLRRYLGLVYCLLFTEYRYNKAS